MTYKTQESVTHIDSDTGRELTVTSEFEDKFPGVAEHWVKGGEVEFRCIGCVWVAANEKQLKRLVLDKGNEDKFRIKKRKPKTGEVWTNNDGEPHIYGCALRGSAGYGFIGLDGRSSYADSYSDDFKYAAPSVSAYYARELIKGLGDKNKNMSLGEMQSILDGIIEACEYDKG